MDRFALRAGVAAHVSAEIGKAVDQQLNRVRWVVGVEAGFLGHQLPVVHCLEQAGRFEPILFVRLAIIIPALLVLLLGIVFVSVPYEYVKNAWFLTYYVEGMSI